MGDVKEGKLKYVKAEKLWEQHISVFMAPSHHITSHHVTVGGEDGGKVSLP